MRLETGCNSTRHRKGAEGLVYMAKHNLSGNVVAIKFHTHEAARNHSFEILKLLQPGGGQASKYVAGLAGGLPVDHIKFDDRDENSPLSHPDQPFALVTDGGVQDLYEVESK